MLRQKLIETRQIPRRRVTCHVIEGQHGVRLTAAEVGLELDHGVAPNTTKPLGRADQKRSQAVGQVCAAENSWG